MGKNVVLIGMPGSGKSTVGKILSARLNFGFIDTDSLVKDAEGLSPRDIVSKHGLEYFLEAQERTVLGIDVQDHVIATGGSVIYGAEAMEHLKKGGTVIFLDTRYRDIEERQLPGRRLARRDGQDLLALYRERLPLYRKYADMTVDCTGKRADEIADEIFSLLNEKR